MGLLRGYSDHPVAVADMSPGDDATANETLAITCHGGSVQYVTLTWGWFDDAWRAAPDYRLTASGDAVEYPGCP